MIHFSKLGRYEYTNYSQNSDKFYTVKFISENNYEIQYGKNGYPAQQVLSVNESIAATRIKEKIKKGYNHVKTTLDDEHEKAWILHNKNNLEILLEKKVATKRIKI